MFPISSSSLLLLLFCSVLSHFSWDQLISPPPLRIPPVWNFLRKHFCFVWNGTGKSRNFSQKCLRLQKKVCLFLLVATLICPPPIFHHLPRLWHFWPKTLLLLVGPFLRSPVHFSAPPPLGLRRRHFFSETDLTAAVTDLTILRSPLLPPSSVRTLEM